MNKLNNNNYITLPSNPVSGRANQHSPVDLPGRDGGELVATITDLFRVLQSIHKDLIKIKTYLHIDEKPAQVIDIKVLANREAVKFMRGKYEGGKRENGKGKK